MINGAELQSKVSIHLDLYTACQNRSSNLLNAASKRFWGNLPQLSYFRWSRFPTNNITLVLQVLNVNKVNNVTRHHISECLCIFLWCPLLCLFERTCWTLPAPCHDTVEAVMNRNYALASSRQHKRLITFQDWLLQCRQLNVFCGRAATHVTESSLRFLFRILSAVSALSLNVSGRAEINCRVVSVIILVFTVSNWTRRWEK